MITINYYRVKQVDSDGKYEYSNVPSSFYQSSDITIFPNPVTDRLTISLPNEKLVAIYNILGHQVDKYRLDEGENVVDMAQMESGLHLLKFDNESVERVVKR